MIYYLDLAIREGNYLLEQEPFAPDTYISVLTSDLASMEEVFSETLPEKTLRCVLVCVPYVTRLALVIDNP